MPPPNPFVSTGRSLLGPPMADIGGFDGLVYFGRQAVSAISPTLQVDAIPVVLKAYGLLPGESVAVLNLYEATGATAPFSVGGAPIVLAHGSTTAVLSLRGAYKLQADVAALGTLLVTATALPQPRELSQGSKTPASQVALPNPYLKNTTLSQKAQITEVPWVYRAYGLQAGSSIAVLNVTTQDGVEATAPYTVGGVAVVLDAGTSTVVLDLSGMYRFELTGNPAGVLLIGNETPILYIDAYSPLPYNGVLEIVAGANVTVNAADPQRPVISATGGGSGGGGVVSVVAGVGITVDSTDTANPVVSTTAIVLSASAVDGDIPEFDGTVGVWSPTTSPRKLYLDGGNF